MESTSHERPGDARAHDHHAAKTDNGTAEPGHPTDASSTPHQYIFDPSGERPLSTIVAEAVSTLTDSEQDELDPLYKTVNPDGLDTLFAGTHTGESRGPAQVTFTYAGYRITAHDDGRLRITDER